MYPKSASAHLFSPTFCNSSDSINNRVRQPMSIRSAYFLHICVPTFSIIQTYINLCLSVQQHVVRLSLPRLVSYTLQSEREHVTLPRRIGLVKEEYEYSITDTWMGSIMHLDFAFSSIFRKSLYCCRYWLAVLWNSRLKCRVIGSSFGRYILGFRR